MKVAVIIPFYQRKRGLLCRAVDSVVASFSICSSGYIEIVIVDDQSPVPVESEIKSVCLDNDRISLRMVVQENGGPGAARNAGLDSIVHQVDVVAFLDSDDTWSLDHVSRLFHAFNIGADLYFANHQRTGELLSRFDECKLYAKHHHKVGDELYIYSGKLFSDILMRSPVGTSTVAFRYANHQNLRFQTDYHAGEDIMFWLDIARQSPRTIFSTRIEATYGRGVNIFHGIEWGTTSDLARLRDSTVFHLMVKHRFKLSEAEHSINKHHLRNLAIAFANSLAGAIRHRELGILPILKFYILLNPYLLLVLPFEWFKLIIRSKK